MDESAEWQAQERARAIERGEAAALPQHDARVAAYRLIARQLADESALPPVPAGMMSALLQRLFATRSLSDRGAWFERALPWWMGAGFAAVAGASWLRGDLPVPAGSAWLAIAVVAALVAAWPFGREASRR